jgi:hypothetical protein
MDISFEVSLLTDKQAKKGYAAAEALAEESRKSPAVYPYFDLFVPLLRHPSSFVRNRALLLIAENVRWDEKKKIDSVLDAYLSLTRDEKPVTVRTCLQNLPKIIAARPDLEETVRKKLSSFDLSLYQESMRPLIAMDIKEILG